MAIEISSKPQTPGSTKTAVKPRAGQKIKASERMFFIEQLALMLETGNDLHRSLKTLRKQCKNPVLANVIGEISDDISEGKTFSAALAKHPETFTKTYVSLIAASESGGYLQRILEHLLEMEQRREELQATLVSAAAYPAFLLVFSFAMVVFILAAVFPKFNELFISIKDQLPITTVWLMSLSQLILNYWWALLVGMACLIYGALFWLKSSSGCRIIASFKINTPVIKTIFIRLYLVQTMRVLGLSLRHGVTLLEALEVSKDVVNNQLFQEFINKLIKYIRDGRKLADGFNETDFIPPMVAQMMTTGEETGNLALVSLRVADYFQKELQNLLKFITKAIEPIMLIVMGTIVGILVSSLILPIFKLSHAVH